MGCSCDRPYPFFKADIETFSALDAGDEENPRYTQYDLGICYLAYQNIHELYNAAMGLLTSAKIYPSKAKKRLQDACKKTYKDFIRANFCISEEQVKTGKSDWE